MGGLYEGGHVVNVYSARRCRGFFYGICIEIVVVQTGCATADMCGNGVSMWAGIGSKCDHRVNIK